MPKKPTSLEQVERSKFRVIDPKDVKQSVEIAVAKKPSKNDIRRVQGLIA